MRCRPDESRRPGSPVSWPAGPRRVRRPSWRLAIAILLGLWSVPALAGDTDEPSSIPRDSPSESEDPLHGGPISTEEQLAEDEREVVPVLRLQWLEDAKAPYYAFKQRVEDGLGLRFGADYTAVFQGASRSRGSNEASAGIFRFYGAWTLFGRDSGNSGALVYKVENRHDLGTSTAAQDLGGELGYVGLTALSFSDYRNKGWGLTNLQWRQGLAGGRVRAVAGIVDPTDYLDLYGLISPWLHFLNVAFSTNPSIFLANQGVGAAVGVRATDHVYGILSVADANADPVDPLGSVDTFFDESEYFKHLEIGWSSSVQDRLSLDNIHLTLWHVDDQSKTGGRDGWGVAAAAAWVFDERWLPFVRAGYSKDGGALYEGSVSWGVGYYVARRRDLLAIGMNWSRPSDTTIEPGLGDQYTMELFYRIQLAADLAITPDLQLIINPALDPSRDSILVAGLRLRLAI